MSAPLIRRTRAAMNLIEDIEDVEELKELEDTKDLEMASGLPDPGAPKEPIPINHEEIDFNNPSYFQSPLP